MAPRRDTSGPKLRTRKKKGLLRYPMPDLFPRAIHEWLRRASAQYSDNHLSPEQQDQLRASIETAWEKADSYTQELFCCLADGLPGKQSQQFVEAHSEPVANDVRPPARLTSRARGKKASARSRAKRPALPPSPAGQVHPATPPPLDNLERTSPSTPHSTCSSVSIPLQAVVRYRGPPPPEPGGAPQAQGAGSALPPYMSPLPTADFPRSEAAPFERHLSFPFAPPGHIPGPPPLSLGPAPSRSVHTGMGLGLISESMDGGGTGGYSVLDVDPSLLDAQRQMRHQMLIYQSMDPSLSYGHMSSAAEHWPWR